MSTDPSDNAVMNPPSAAHRVRVIIFRVVAALAGLFFVVAVVLMASAPWMLLQPDQDVRTELNRWLLTVAGSVDAITAGVLLALAQQPRRTLLVVELVGAVIVAGAIILPFQPSFAAILAIVVVPLIAYPYWRDREPFRPGGPACHGQSSSSRLAHGLVAAADGGHHQHGQDGIQQPPCASAAQLPSGRQARSKY